MSIIPFSFLFYFHFLFFFLRFPSHFFFFNFSSPFNSPRHPPPLPYRDATLPCGLASNRTRRPTPRRASHRQRFPAACIRRLRPPPPTSPGFPRAVMELHLASRAPPSSSPVAMEAARAELAAWPWRQPAQSSSAGLLRRFYSSCSRRWSPPRAVFSICSHTGASMSRAAAPPALVTTRLLLSSGPCAEGKGGKDGRSYGAAGKAAFSQLRPGRTALESMICGSFSIEAIFGALLAQLSN
jgi:hypothetical protein